MKEFKVNKYLILRLENEKTNIYIKGELFQQCKFLLINIPVEKRNSIAKIDSVDAAAELLDPSLEEADGYHYNIPPESEFWAHCSNLQLWYENDYNTKLLHSNLSFFLLKKLYESGDPLAKKKYKEEIAKRFIFSNKKIQDFLIQEGYLEILSREEFLSLVKDSDIITKLETSLGSPMKINTRYNPHPYGFVVENGVIKWLSLNNRGINKLPNLIRELSQLEGLTLRRNSLETLPDWIGDFKQLEVLDLSKNQIKVIPESIGNLQKLKRLELQYNKLKRFPNSFGNLRQLEVLLAHENKIEVLPDSIGNLTSLKDLVLRGSLLTVIPESIGNMISLKTFNISYNPIQNLPDTILYLKNLKSLHLKGVDQKFSDLINNLKRRKVNILK